MIAAQIGAIPELVSAGEEGNGLLFTPGDERELAACLRWMWDHPTQARMMGRNGRQKFVRAYNAEVHYAQLLPLYERVRNREIL
jgi:glycosyltransferase involved in cell wall biosynthesis